VKVEGFDVVLNNLVFQVMEQIAHPRYDPDVVDHDVALLRLPVAVSWMPACLPSANIPLPPAGTMCIVLGWGRRQNQGDLGDAAGTGDLHQAQVRWARFDTNMQYMMRT